MKGSCFRIRYASYSFDGGLNKLKCSGWVLRYFALFLWCIIILGLYMVYDIPGSLQNRIMKNFDLSNYTFAYLYSAYAWPNVITAFLGGLLTDRMGVEISLIVFTSVATLGQLIFVIGVRMDLFALMLVGRVLVGSGCEPSLAALNRIAIIWFTGKELNMIFAIIMNMGRIGSSLVYSAAEPTYSALLKGSTEIQALKYAVAVLGSSVLFSLFCAIINSFLKPEQKEVKSQDDENMVVNPEKKARFLDFTTFPLIFWLLAIVISMYIGIIYSFLSQAQSSFTHKFKVSNNTANSYVSFFSYFGAFLSICFGLLIDYKGRNMIYAVVSLFSFVIGMAMVAYTYINPYISMTVMSISAATFFCSVWSPIAYIIPEHQLGTAFGILQGGMNVFFSIGTLSVGSIAKTYGFQMMHTFLLICIIVTIPTLLCCWALDMKKNKVLNMTAKERNNFLNNQK